MNSNQGRVKTYRSRRSALGWFDVRGRKPGMVAFALNRITGIGLVVYLLLHLAILSLLASGRANWDGFVHLASSPIFLALDVILIAGILIHGLNGIRVALIGIGVGVRSQKSIFVILMVIALVALIYAAFRVFTA